MAQDHHSEPSSSSQISCRILPTDFSKCKIVITLLSGTLEPELEIVYDKDIDLTIGLAENEVMDQIEVTLLSMEEEELTQITVDRSPPCKCTGPNKHTSFTEGASSDDSVILGVKLISFHREKDVWLLSPHEKLERAQQLKEKGVQLFKKSNYEMAFRKFSRALKYSILVGNKLPQDIESDCTKLKCQCYLNIGACQLQKENYCSVIDNCSKALCLDSNSVKGLYRRAQALFKLDDYGSAVEDLSRAKILEPGNKAVVRLLSTASVELKKQEEKFADGMSKMFV